MTSSLARAEQYADAVARPLLKWAGGKRQLLPQIRRFYPSDFRAYFEPFAGSAAVFFDLINNSLLDSKSATLIDNNQDLVGCYYMVRDRTSEVIAALRRLEKDYRVQGEKHFYRVRDERFNPQRNDSLSRAGGSLSEDYTPSLAAMLIYLNRTGFNGLFRLNSKGLYNVPHGRYSNPLICDEDNLRVVATALRRQGIEVVRASFEEVLQHASASDFVYFDPPYAPLSATSVFTSYTAQGFDQKNQEHLRDVVVRLVERGCKVLLSNSTATEIAELYDNDSMSRLGIKSHKVPAKRAINSDPSARGNIDEYLISNIEPRA
jgi:DNA adenine methylase